MSKLSKKILALVMALAMVVTMLPLNAMMAFGSAATVNYFYDDCETGNADADRGGKVITGSVDATDTYTGTSSANGYTVNFWYKPNTLDHTILNIGDAAGTYSFFCICANGDVRYNNGHESYADITGAKVWGDALTSGVWHNLEIRILQNGSRDTLNFYVDGVLTKTVNTADYSSVKDGGTICNYFANNHNVYYNSSYSGWYGAADGAIDDVIIYPNRYVDVDTTLGIYEALMASGVVYNNMADLYAAYTKVNAALDAEAYGTKSNISGAAATALMNALNNATQYSATRFSANGSVAWMYYNNAWVSDNGLVKGTHYNNVLGATYSGSQGAVSSKLAQSGNFHEVNIKIYSPLVVVWLYDGVNDLKAPVAVMARKTVGWTGGNRQLKQAYFTSSSVTSATSTQPNEHAKLGLVRSWYSNSTARGSDEIYYSASWTGTSAQPSAVKGTMNAGANLDNSDNGKPYVNAVYYRGGAFNAYGDDINDIYWWGNSDSGLTVRNADQHYKVVNYVYYGQQIRNALRSKVSGITDGNFRENELAALMTAVDTATALDPNMSGDQYSDKINAMSSNVTAINNAAVTNNTDYDALETTFTGSGTTADNETLTYAAAYNNGVNAGFTAATWAPYKTAYEAVVALYNNNYDNSLGYSGNAAAAKSALETAMGNLERDASIVAPSVTADTLLASTDTITVTNNDENATSVEYTLTYNNGNTANGSLAISEGESDTLAPFDVTVFPAAEGAESVAINATVTVSGNLSAPGTATYTLYKYPTGSPTVLQKNENITLTSQNGAYAGTIMYSYDGNSWEGYSAPFAPFANSGAGTRTIYVKEIGTGVESSVGQITVARAGSLTAYADPTPELGADYYNGDSTIKLATADTYDSIKYKVQKDTDNDFGSEQTYSAAGFAASAYANNSFIIIKAYAEGNEDNATVTTLYNEDLYNPLAYQESFNDVTVTNGSTADVLQSANGYNMTAGANTISVLEGAGTKSSSTESYSWRNNVLKINAKGTAPGPVVTLNKNPLNQAINAAAVQKNGVTISFWRHIENSNGETVNLPTSGDWTGYPWRNAIAFQKDGDNSVYYIIEMNGVNSRRVDGSNYLDVCPENQDYTLHEQGNASGEWEHVAITIDPNSGIKVYTNGSEHQYRVVAGHSEGIFNGGNNAAAAQEILAFLSDGTTQMTLDNGVLYEGNEYNLFLDDIRLYTKPLTQVEINNMYTDEYTDTVSASTSTSHDPTSVAVYTLSNGKKVGQEYIDYNNISDSEIAAIDYYSFGTGMTIYHATDASQTKWEVLGDSEGRCGYQNQELFGAEYHTALAEPLAWAATDTQHEGAGHLVWAPHVMYNITRDEWVYYGSTSSWGSGTSAIFMCTSQNPISGYTYQGIVYKSSVMGPNAIDSMIYYGRDANGDIDPNQLYMALGSWTQQHNSGRYGAIYGVQINADGTAPTGMNTTPDCLEEPGNHGSFTSVELARGYTGNLESDFNNGNDGASSGSGEGVWIQYIDGYYYMFVSYGQNEGSYSERVFRSTDPLGRTKESSDGYAGFVSYEGNRTWSAINDKTPDAGQQDFVRGNQLIAPFDMSMYDTVMRSTGHSSLYKVKTLNNEWVWVNAIHGRPYASQDHGWIAVPDNALAKRQLDSGNRTWYGVTGNVCMNNMVALNEDGWMVIFPNQYNGTDSYSTKLTAKDIEGVYTADDMRKVVNSDWGREYKYTILADKVHKDQGVALGYKDGIQFTSKFKLTYDNEKKIQYITMYVSSDVDPATATPDQIRYKGVVATHIGKDKYGNSKLIPMFGMMNTYQGDDNPHALYKGELAWAYRSGEVPNASEVVSKVDAVALDGVIYTHASDAQEAAVAANHSTTTAAVAKSSYALYGQEIADNFAYGNGQTNAERYTTLTVAWPMKLDMSNPSAIYNYSDEEHTRDGGNTGSEIVAVPLNKNNGVFEPCYKDGYSQVKDHQFDDSKQYWYDKSTGNVVSDAQIAEMSKEQRKNVVRYYGFTGYVSDYFKYNDDTSKYTEDGVELIVSYIAVADSDETDPQTGEPLYRAGQEQQEFEFAYVMPNPAWAHTIAATKNNNSDTGNNRNSSLGTINRFEDSWGVASELSSAMLRYAASGNDNGSGWGYGVSGYLSDFEAQNFSTTDLDTLDEIKTLMIFTNRNEGVNSGSFSAGSHDDEGCNSYVACPQIIDTNYYVDYSNEQLYDIGGGSGLITTENGRPTGYQFKMRTNNFLWANYSGASIMDTTSYAMNNTGLKVTYRSKAAYSQPNVNEYLHSFTSAGIYDSNYPYFRTCNSWGISTWGNRNWYDDTMLFATDTRYSTNHSYFTYRYRNKVLYYFSDRDIGNMQYLKTNPSDSDGNIKYLDGTVYPNNPSKVWNYFDYTNENDENIGSTAYRTAPNGKAATNDWWGEATFTGKDSVIPNTLESLKKQYPSTNSGIHAGLNDNNQIRLYDGYWFKDANGREDWTADAATANQYTNHGNLDVTAENYANFILEMGNYHRMNAPEGLFGDKEDRRGGWMLGSETYHYYNIGVHTCDKGAMRQFAEEMMNKDIHEDPNTGEIVIEGTVLDNARYSYASYKDYIDAIAKCMWFVEDPTKTTFGDIKDEARYADVYEAAKEMYIEAELGGDASAFDEDVFDATEYTTGYDAQTGKAYYLNDNNHVGTTIFYDGTTTKTDYVQAALVKDVLKAYEDLYDVNNYVAVEDEFKKTETFFNNAAMEDAAVYEETGEHKYSPQSMNNFNEALNAIRENAVNYYVYNDANYGPHKDTYNADTDTYDENAKYEAKDKDGNPILDKDGNPIIYDIIDTPSSVSEAFWRTTELSGADYEELKDYMKELRGSLSEPVDLSPLADQVGSAVVPQLDSNGKLVVTKNADGMMTGYASEAARVIYNEEAPLSKTAMNEKGIFDDEDTQIYSYGSWADLDEALHNGDAADYVAYEANPNLPRAEETANREASAAAMVAEDGADEILSEVERGGSNKYATLGERQLNGILNLPTTGIDPETGENYKIYKYEILLDASDENSPYFSRDQLAINEKAEELAPLYLEQVDTPAAYSSYNSAYAVASAIDFERYTDAAKNDQGHFDVQDEMARRDPEVYVQVTQEVADRYNARVGADKTKLTPATGREGELRVRSLEETDPYTERLLTYANYLESKDTNGDYLFVKKFKATLAVTKIDAAGQTTSSQPVAKTVYYGDNFHFDMSPYLDYATEEVTDPDTGETSTQTTERIKQAVSYSVTTFDGEAGDFDDAEATGSQKWTYTGKEFDRVADSNVSIIATVIEDKTSTNDIAVKFYNIYGRLVETRYVGDTVTVDNLPSSDEDLHNQTLTIGDSTYTAERVPFYNFEKFEREVSADNKTVSYKAKYTADEMFTYAAPEGATVAPARAKLDTMVTLSGADQFDGFKAWLVKTLDNKYSVASYSSTYSFIAIESAEFAVLTKDSTTGAYTITKTDGTTVALADDASVVANISGTIGEFVSDTGTQNYPYGTLKFFDEKIEQKLPFIAVLKAKKGSEQDVNNKYTHVLYGLITEGYTSTALNNVTVTINNGNKDAVAKVTNMKYGQFTVSVKSGNNANTFTGIGAVNYKFSYTDTIGEGDPTTITINAKDTTQTVTYQ